MLLQFTWNKVLANFANCSGERSLRETCVESLCLSMITALSLQATIALCCVLLLTVISFTLLYIGQDV